MDEIFHKTGSLDDIIHKGMDVVDGAAHEIEHGVEVVGHEIEKDAKKAGHAIEHAGDGLKPKQGLLQRRRQLPYHDDECETVEEVFRHAVEEVIHHTIEVFFDPHHLHHEQPLIAAPGPAVPNGMQPHAFLQSAPAPAPMMAAIESREEIEVYVVFEPGRAFGPGNNPGKTIIVEILVTDALGGIEHDLTPLEHMFEEAMYSALFNNQMAAAFQKVTGVAPAMGVYHIKKKHIDLWNVTQCEGHLKSLISRFSRTYTRERVPSALYNECTNFMTKISFSHDYVLDRQDSVVCEKTTARFAKHWDYGKNPALFDFELMCVAACKHKFGKHAPKCQHEEAAGPSPAPSPYPAR
jgi:hypothetical protein